MSMGGGASGGGQSGKVDYPVYIKNWHDKMLHNVFSLVKGAYKAPTSYLYDPKVWFGAPANQGVYPAIKTFGAINVESLFKSIVSDTYEYSLVLNEDSISDIKAKAEALRNILTSTPEAATNEVIDSYSVKLLQRVDSDVIPKIEVGMRDAGAVIGTSFVIAKELAMEHYTAEVADFSAKVKMRFWELLYGLYQYLEQQWITGAIALTEVAMKRVAQKLEHAKAHVVLLAEVANAATLAQSKYGVVRTEDEIRSKTWKLDLWDHMNKTLASIAGASPVRQATTAGQTMFSGILGMAAMGAGVGGYLASGSTLGGLAGGAQAGGTLGMAGGPVGAIAGGVLGAGAGLLMGMFSK